MIDVGAKTVNPRTGTEWEIVEMQDSHFRLRFSSPAPAHKQEVAEHFHIGWHEEFEILEGEATYAIDKKEARAKAGDRIAMPEKLKHVHPYNTGSGPLVYEQIGTITGHDKDAARRTFAFFFTMYDWEAAGKIKLDKVGLPAHPLKFALAGRILTNAGGYDARIPKAVGDFGGATFGRLAEALGYQVIDPKYL